MELQKIKALIGLASEAGLSYFEFTEGECTLRLERGGRVAVAPATGGRDSALRAMSGECRPSAPCPAETTPAAVEPGVVSAPMLGILYLSAKPGEPPFVATGDAVRKGQKLALLEAMKVFHAVEAQCEGVVREVLAREGQEVEIGQPLFRIE